MGMHGRGKPLPTRIPPAPAGRRSSSGRLEVAAGRLVAAVEHVISSEHLEHAPACPFSGGGACVCGFLELKDALEALNTALEA